MSLTRVSPLLAVAAVLAVPAARAAGDADNGKELFTSKLCVTCHAIAKDDAAKIGPNLLGVVGRKAGVEQGLVPPSAGLKSYGVKWNDKTLDEFLINPQAKAPGTLMAGVLPDAQDRADVIAYLKTLKK